MEKKKKTTTFFVVYCIFFFKNKYRSVFSKCVWKKSSDFTTADNVSSVESMKEVWKSEHI